MGKDPNCYSVTEVAKILHTQPQIVRFSMQHNYDKWDIPFMQVGKQIRIPKKPFHEWYSKRYGGSLT